MEDRPSLYPVSSSYSGFKVGSEQYCTPPHLRSAGAVAPILQAPRSLRAAILSGSMTLLVGSGLVSIINLIYNIVLARTLSATGFGQAVSVYTLLMMLSAVTLSFQIACSKFVAKNVALATIGRGVLRPAPPDLADRRPRWDHQFCADHLESFPGVHSYRDKNLTISLHICDGSPTTLSCTDLL
jgi:hypothetical protein